MRTIALTLFIVLHCLQVNSKVYFKLLFEMLIRILCPSALPIPSR